jgi:hypothetical protein
VEAQVAVVQAIVAHAMEKMPVQPGLVQMSSVLVATEKTIPATAVVAVVVVAVVLVVQAVQLVAATTKVLIQA